MTYFARTIFIYLILFGATAYTVNWAVQKFYYPQALSEVEGEPISLTYALPSFAIPPRETETGLLLAGLAAQNRRDWGGAWQSFSALNDKYSNNPDFALRAFTLALGNGEYTQTENIATRLDTLLHDKESAEAAADKYDLVRLFVVFKHVKQGEYDIALQETGTLANGALAAFATPILNDWINAEINPAAISPVSAQLNALQLYYKAFAAEYADRDDLALQAMNRVDMNILTPEKIEAVAEFYVRMEKPKKAIDIVRRHLVKFQGNEHLGVLLADLQRHVDTGDVMNDLRPTLTPQSAIAEAFHDFATFMLSEGAFDSTLLFARLAAYLDPDTADVYFTMADVLKYQEQYEQALIAYRNIGIEDARYETAIAEQVDLYVKIDDIPAARDVLQRALQNERDQGIAESPVFYFLLGNLSQDEKDYNAALEMYNKAESLALEQNDGELPQALWPVYYSRAIIYDLTDQWELAEKDLLMALEKFPENPIILNYLGYAYADRNINLDKAKEMISRAVMAAPNDAYIIDSMGWILYRTGDYDQAVNFLERAASLRPYHMVINDHLGDAYWHVGRKIEAHYMWRRALDYYDENDEEQQRMIDETRRKLKEGL